MLSDRPKTALTSRRAEATGVGPGTYNPYLPSSSTACLAQFRSKSVRGQPFAWRLVGPGAYDVPLGHHICGGLSAFRGGVRTLDMTNPCQVSTPGPGSYDVPSSLAIPPVQAPVKAAVGHFQWRRRPTAPVIPAHRDDAGHAGPWSYSPQYDKASRQRCVCSQLSRERNGLLPRPIPWQPEGFTRSLMLVLADAWMSLLVQRI